MIGTVYLVGAGPGAPDLLTLRAARLLERADVVFFDALVHPDTLALAARAALVPVGKRCGRFSTAQRFINKRLVEAAQKYSTVVRLKGGDPMLFARAQEEIEALNEAGVPFEVVPGVTAALAASADLGVPLSWRGLSRSVAFVTPRAGADEPANAWLQTALAADTAVLYMASHEAARIAATLIENGKAPTTPVAIVESASLPESRRVFTTLARLRDAPQPRFSGPTTVLIGGVYANALAADLAQADDSIVEQVSA